MIKLVPGRASILAALLIFSSSAVVAKELATIETHTQRYGSHVAISAYDDPLVKGVTCYVSESHSDGALHPSRPLAVGNRRQGVGLGNSENPR